MHRNTVKRIILHIGLPKTGTSSIQQSLYENQALLTSYRMSYPVFEGINHADINMCFVPDRLQEYYNIVNDRIETSSIEHHKSEYAAFLKREISKKRPKTVIISTESLFKKFDITFIEYLKAITNRNVELTVLCYVRDPVDWIKSASQQMIKYPKVTTNEDFRELVGERGIKSFEWWVSTVGADHINVFSLETARQHSGGLISHFYQQLGVENIDGLIEPRWENETISLEAACLIQYINKKVPLYVGTCFNTEQGRAQNDTNMLFDIGQIKFERPISKRKQDVERAEKFRRYLKTQFGIEYPIVNIGDECDEPAYMSEAVKHDILKRKPMMSKTIAGLVDEFLAQCSHMNLYDILNQNALQ